MVALAVPGISVSGAPRSQSAHGVPASGVSAATLFALPGPTGYLRTAGPVAIRLVAPVEIVRAPRPAYPPDEELARDPEAYAEASAARRGYGNVASPDRGKGDAVHISVGGDVLPEVSVTPYSNAMIRPEDVVLFFKDEELDGLHGGIAYPAARLRFDPARREVRTSSSATYTSQ